uniref:Uncharacterized protein n=1 Tax=Arundo donax TaxID=35708 RepID=A0A0A9GTZ8_ARUDO
MSFPCFYLMLFHC